MQRGEREGEGGQRAQPARGRLSRRSRTWRCRTNTGYGQVLFAGYLGGEIASGYWVRSRSILLIRYVFLTCAFLHKTERSEREKRAQERREHSECCAQLGVRVREKGKQRVGKKEAREGHGENLAQNEHRPAILQRAQKGFGPASRCIRAAWRCAARRGARGKSHEEPRTNALTSSCLTAARARNRQLARHKCRFEWPVKGAAAYRR